MASPLEPHPWQWTGFRFGSRQGFLGLLSLPLCPGHQTVLLSSLSTEHPLAGSSAGFQKQDTLTLRAQGPCRLLMGPIPHLSPSFLGFKMGQQSTHCRLPQGVEKVLQGLAPSLTGKEGVWAGPLAGASVNKLQIQTPDDSKLQGRLCQDRKG